MSHILDATARWLGGFVAESSA